MAATNDTATEGRPIKHIETQETKAQNDTTAHVVGTDNGKTAIGTSANDTGTMINAEKSAHTMSQLGLDKFHIDEGTKLDDILKHSNEPTDQERKDAQSKLDGQVSKLLSPEDQKTLGAMQKAVLDGDPKAFGDAIAKFKDNPEKLKAFLDEMNKNLKQSGSDTRADVDSQGNVILHNGGDTGVVFGKDGKPSVHEITHRPDGSVVVGGEVVGGEGAADVMKRIGNSTVIDIERNQPIGTTTPPWGGPIYPDPRNPDPREPHFPWPPEPKPVPDWPQPDWPHHDRPDQPWLDELRKHPDLYMMNRKQTSINKDS